MALLEKLNLIERAHGAWAGNPNVLYVRPTKRVHAVWDTATTFEALNAVLGNDSPLHKLWQAWPDADPKKLGEIAVWYEQLDKLNMQIYGKPLDLKPCALDLLQLMLKSDPTIANTDAEHLQQRLRLALSKIGIEQDAKGNLTPAVAEPSSQM